jgi:hypothetical protein
MTMHYRLASNRATVDSDVETQHARILLQDELSGFGPTAPSAPIRAGFGGNLERWEQGRTQRDERKPSPQTARARFARVPK